MISQDSAYNNASNYNEYVDFRLISFIITTSIATVIKIVVVMAVVVSFRNPFIVKSRSQPILLQQKEYSHNCLDDTLRDWQCIRVSESGLRAMMGGGLLTPAPACLLARSLAPYRFPGVWVSERASKHVTVRVKQVST